jgi:hypothetical protein
MKIANIFMSLSLVFSIFTLNACSSVSKNGNTSNTANVATPTDTASTPTSTTTTVPTVTPKIIKNGITYKSNPNHFIISFPSWWKDKYTVEEDKNGITVYHKKLMKLLSTKSIG